MRVLILKLSSMGDILHTLPAITDAANAHPEIVFDWVVEEAFAEIPTWHPNIHTIIPFALRRWRSSLCTAFLQGEIRQFLRDLRSERYDLIIDPQGLIKSAALSLFSRGPTLGFAKSCIRESIARFAYARKFSTNRHEHAITRIRKLFAHAFHYDCPKTPPDYGITLLPHPHKIEAPYIVFLHGTSRAHKQWPTDYWRALAALANTAGLTVKLTFGNATEHHTALEIADQMPHVEVLDKMPLHTVANLLSHARGVVAVDTGLGHLTAALGTPCVSLYGPSSPESTGALGLHQIHLQADNHDLANLRPEYVWQNLYDLLSRS